MVGDINQLYQLPMTALPMAGNAFHINHGITIQTLLTYASFSATLNAELIGPDKTCWSRIPHRLAFQLLAAPQHHNVPGVKKADGYFGWPEWLARRWRPRSATELSKSSSS